MIKDMLFDTTFLLPFFGIDLEEINQLTDKAYLMVRKMYFAEISIYEVKFKLVSLYRKGKIPFELLNDFWRNLSILIDDSKIKFIEYDEQIDRLVNALERDDKINLSIIDQIIVATASKVSVLVTLDNDILKHKALLREEYGITVYSLEDLKKLLS